MEKHHNAAPERVAIPKRVTLKVIAERADVHVSTVSRALNPHESDKVRPETLRRVRELADELGYSPDPWGRNLRTQRSLMIGLILPRLIDGVLAIMFEAAEDHARALGYQALTTSTRDRPEEQRRLVEQLLDRRVDGLILATPVLDDPLLDELADRHVPFVLMNRTSGDHLGVRPNDERGGFLAAAHLIDAGHRRIGMIAGPSDVSTSVGRRRGFLAAHAARAVPVDPSLVRDSTFLTTGYNVALDLLSIEDPPTALFAVNDATAVAAMAAARRVGLAVPEDLAIVGYYDSPLARILPVPLSSVALPLGRMGQIAVDLLVSRLRGEDPEPVVLEPELIVRESSAAVESAADGGGRIGPDRIGIGNLTPPMNPSG